MERTDNDTGARASATELFEAIKNGDEVAFSRYYESSMPWLVPFICRITRDLEEARNIAHDTFAKLWLQRDRIDPRQSLDGFVSRISTNAALNLVKRKQYHYKYFDEQIFLQNTEDASADAPLLTVEMESRIAEVIRRMPPQRRMVYELSRKENLTYNEIASRMGLSQNTVRNYMALALENIRSVLSISLVFFTSFVR